MYRSVFATALVVLAGFSSAQPAEAAEPTQACSDLTEPPGEYRFTITPGVAWGAWREMIEASQPALSSGKIFDEERIKEAAAHFSLETPPLIDSSQDYPFVFNYSKSYKHDGYQIDVPLEAAIYKEKYKDAASDYALARWSESIEKFDLIASDVDSPYRAAAAYSAARAAFNAGDIMDGIHRISALLADPAMEEFHDAAHKLIGTKAYQIGEGALNAARFAEISHILMTPSDVFCSAGLGEVIGRASDDLMLMTGSVTYPGKFAEILSRGPAWSGRHDAFVALIASDPFLDLYGAIALNSQYTSAGGWSSKSDFTDLDSIENLAFSPDASRHAAEHARERWQSTRNPLWAYAVAKHSTNLDDIAILDAARNRLAELARNPMMDTAKRAMDWPFIYHHIRLLLMNGRLDEAIIAMTTAPEEFAPPSVWYTNRDENKERLALAGGLYLLGKRDLAAMRRWTTTTFKAGQGTWISGLSASNSRELINLVGRNPTIDGSNSTLLNYLPARRLIELSAEPDISNHLRRSLLSAGWIRLVILGQQEEALSLLPQIRAAFPELATDLDPIDAAWTRKTKWRRLVRLVLRNPGLSPSLIWTRAGSGQYSRGASLASADSHNPNDGNWWCRISRDSLDWDLFDYSPLANAYLANAEQMDRFSVGNVKKVAAISQSLFPIAKEFDFDELDKLAAANSGPHQLTDIAIDWADDMGWFSRLIGRDDYLAETLHLAVRSTRYGCRRMGGHGAYSRAAYIRLHNSYPKSEWSKRTPYWFDRFDR